MEGISSQLKCIMSYTPSEHLFRCSIFPKSTRRRRPQPNDELMPASMANSEHGGQRAWRTEGWGSGRTARAASITGSGRSSPATGGGSCWTMDMARFGRASLTGDEQMAPPRVDAIHLRPAAATHQDPTIHPS
ncbi:hypothetical protein ACLOJK_036769 [Asimina triloba]